MPSSLVPFKIAELFARTKSRIAPRQGHPDFWTRSPVALEQRLLLSANVALTPGVDKLGSITLGETDSFSFEAQQGDVAFFVASPLFASSTFTLDTTIFDPDNQVIYQSGAFSHQIELDISKSGTYRIIFQDGNNDSTGGYNLEVAIVPPISQPLLNFQLLTESGRHLTASFNPGEMDLFKFQLDAPGKIHYIIADQLKRDGLAFHVTIFDNNRQKIYERVSQSHEIELDNLQAGEYAIIVRDEHGDTQVAHFHTLIKLPSSHTLIGFNGPLTSNKSALNSVSAGGAGLNEITLNQGDKLFFNLAPFSLPQEGLLHVTIYGPNLEKIYDKVQRTHASQFFGLPAGKYTIVVREDGGDVYGSYSQTFIRLPGVQDPSAAEGSLTIGSQRVHTLSSGDIDLFSFNANDGESFRFTNSVDTEVPNLSSQLTILRPNGGVLYNAIAVSHNVPLLFLPAGTYTILIRDDRGDANGNVTSLLTRITEGFPSALDLSKTTIAENLPAGTTIGNFSTTDSDVADTHTYSLVSGTGSTDNASFQIVGNELRTNASFNFEAKSSYSIRVRTTDQGGLFFEKTFTITVTNVNEAPTNISLTSSSVSENQPSGTTVGSFLTTDPDAGDSFTYQLINYPAFPDNNAFQIVGNELRTNTTFDFEAKSSYTIRVRTTDQSGLSWVKTLAINVTQANQAPSDITLSSAVIAENLPAGRFIGTFATSDPDAGNSFTYELINYPGFPDNAAFMISGKQLRTNTSFNFEAKSSYKIRVRTTDQNGLSFSKTFTITITNINERPTSIILSNAAIPENSPVNTTVGRFSTLDPDTGNTFTYALVGGDGATDNSKFRIIGNQLRTLQSFDFETRPSYSIRVRTTDQSGMILDQIFTILISNVIE